MSSTENQTSGKTGQRGFREVMGLPKVDNIRPNPNISLYFTGLLLMAYYENEDKTEKRVEVGVHNNAPDHSFKIYVKKISRTAVPHEENLLELEFDHARPWYNEIYFEVKDQAKPNRSPEDRVKCYQNDPFDRDSFSGYFGEDDYGALSIDDPRDFRWLIDFENRELHGEGVTVLHPESLSPRIYVKDGVFHTARRTRRTFDRVHRASQERKYYGALAHVVGANVHLEREQEGVLTIGAEDEMRLTFPYDPYTSYKIGFVNGPEPPAPPHRDFSHYYKVLETEDGKTYDLCAYGDKLCMGLQEDTGPEYGRSISMTTGGNGATKSDGGTGTGDTGTGGSQSTVTYGGSDIVPCAPGFLGQKNGLPPIE